MLLGAKVHRKLEVFLLLLKLEFDNAVVSVLFTSKGRRSSEINHCSTIMIPIRSFIYLYLSHNSLQFVDFFLFFSYLSTPCLFSLFVFSFNFILFNFFLVVYIFLFYTFDEFYSCLLYYKAVIKVLVLFSYLFHSFFPFFFTASYVFYSLNVFFICFSLSFSHRFFSAYFSIASVLSFLRFDIPSFLYLFFPSFSFL